MQEMTDRYLYRGVSARMYADTGGIIRPRKTDAFTYSFHWGERGAKYNSGIKYGESEANAVVRHQLNQEGFPTSGVSTTPHYERAVVYARGKGGTSNGYVYRIDRDRLTDFDIREFVVAEYVKEPSIPEDDEVILVTPDGGAVPAEIADVLKIGQE